MLWYKLTVYFLLAKRLGGVVLVDDDNSDQTSVLDRWWNPGCNELSGCKNWMRGMWTEAAHHEFLQRGSSLAEAPLDGQWVHDDSETPTTTQHGWIASKINYEDHVLLLEHDSEENNPECFPNGLVKMPNSTLNGKSIHPGSVLLVEQCVQADGGSVEHFGTVTRVHHDGTYVHASTDFLTRDEVQLHVNGGSASFLLPLADEMTAEDASTAAKLMIEANQFLERGSLQRVVKSSPSQTSPSKVENKMLDELALPVAKMFAFKETITAAELKGASQDDAAKILAAYKTEEGTAKSTLEAVACDTSSPTLSADTISGGCLTSRSEVCPANSYCSNIHCRCKIGYCKKQGTNECQLYTASAAIFGEAKKSWTGEFVKHSAWAPGTEGTGVRAGLTGTISGAYNATAKIGARFSAGLTWTSSSVTKFSASVTGDTSLSLTATAKISGSAFLHVYLLNYVELNLGDFVGLPMLKLAVKPVVALDVEANANGNAKFVASWAGSIKIGNDANSNADDTSPVDTVTSSNAVPGTLTLDANGHVNAALKVSIVFTAGVDVILASAKASISATLAAEFLADFPKVAAVCPQFQLTSRADASMDASLLWMAWTRQFVLKKLDPIEVCGGDFKQKCIWYFGSDCGPSPGSSGRSMSEINYLDQLDDYYHNL